MHLPASLPDAGDEQPVSHALQDRAKSAFVTNMTHEFRTPLNAIIGFAEVLQEESCGPLTEQQRKYGANIHLSGRHLLRLVNEILDLSKFESGQIQLDYAPFPIARLLREAEAIMRVLAERKQIDLAVDGAAVHPDLILVADEERVRETLMNLMANAIRFTAVGGRVRVRICVARAPAAPSNTARPAANRILRFEVEDNGVGIAPEDQKRIFEEFQQADASHSREHGGTGLGLALARRFVQLHRGSIGVESELGKGATFWFTIPLAPPTTPTRRESTPSPRTRRVEDRASPSVVRPLALVVEDDQRGAEFLGLCLRQAGYGVLYASDGREALAKARALRPSAVVLDVLVPVFDGWQVLSRLKADATLREIPVVMASVLDYRDRALREGAFEFLVKPIDRERLVQIVAASDFPRPAPRRPVTILVADGDPKAVDRIRAAVAPSGFQVVQVGDGQRAVQAAVASRPDLLVLELELPGLDGAAVLQAVREAAPERPIPAVVVAGREPGSEAGQRLRSLGASVVSRRRFSGAAFLEDVGRLVGSRLYAGDARAG